MLAGTRVRRFRTTDNHYNKELYGPTGTVFESKVEADEDYFAKIDIKVRWDTGPIEAFTNRTKLINHLVCGECGHYVEMLEDVGGTLYRQHQNNVDADNEHAIPHTYETVEDTGVIDGNDIDELEDVTPEVFVNVYLTDRAYGGPEEGGWWYDTEDPIEDESVMYSTEEEAKNKLEEKEAWCRQQNSERNSNISSVLSEGRFIVRCEAWPGTSSPGYHPRYS